MYFTHSFPQPILNQNTVPCQPGIYILIGKGTQAEIFLVDQGKNEPGRTGCAKVMFSELGFDFKFVLRRPRRGNRIKLGTMTRRQESLDSIPEEAPLPRLRSSRHGTHRQKRNHLVSASGGHASDLFWGEILHGLSLL